MRNLPVRRSPPPAAASSPAACRKVLEAGIDQRTVIVEFDSVERADAAYRSEAYQAALAALGNGAERDIRFIEGVR
jgi:uncharacterized protein (DUF1330 family)